MKFSAISIVLGLLFSCISFADSCVLIALNAAQRSVFSQFGYIPGFQNGCLVVQQDNNNVYEWTGTNYVQLSGPSTVLPSPVAGNVVYTTGSAYALIPAGTAGQILKSNGTSAPSWTTNSAVPGGSNTQVQFNDSGAFGGNGGLTFDKGSGLLSVASIGGSGNTYVDVAGQQLIDSAAAVSINWTAREALDDASNPAIVWAVGSRALINAAGTTMLDFLSGPILGAAGNDTNINGDIVTIGAGTEIRANSKNIKNVADPVSAQDAATKAYVDSKIVHSNLVLDTGNGYGSSGTSTRVFTNVTDHSGGDLTYTPSATNGDSITVNTAGHYEVQWCDYSDGSFPGSADPNIGITVNQADSTTRIVAVPKAKRFGIATCAGAFTICCAHADLDLSVNDIIKPTGDSSAKCDSTDALSQFWVQRLN